MINQSPTPTIEDLASRLDVLFEKTFTKFANETLREGVIEQIVTEATLLITKAKNEQLDYLLERSHRMRLGGTTVNAVSVGIIKALKATTEKG